MESEGDDDLPNTRELLVSILAVLRNVERRLESPENVISGSKEDNDGKKNVGAPNTPEEPSEGVHSPEHGPGALDDASLIEGPANDTPADKGLVVEGPAGVNPLVEQVAVEESGGEVSLESKAREYSDFPPRESWAFASARDCFLDVDKEMKKVWHDNIGDSWAVPPDGRIELSFQEHVLERLGSETTEWLKALRLFNRQLSKLNGRISDKYRHPFVIVDMYWKPESLAHPSDSEIGSWHKSPDDRMYYKQYFPEKESGNPDNLRKKTEISTVHQPAPWRRLIEIQGLSNTRKTFQTCELAAPEDGEDKDVTQSPFCPFLLRERNIGSYPLPLEIALSYHINCLRGSVIEEVFAPFTQYNQLQYTVRFHITFYEFIGFSENENPEVTCNGEGKLPDDKAEYFVEKNMKEWYEVAQDKFPKDAPISTRRLRESSCTITAVYDKGSFFHQLSTSESALWTILFLTPVGFLTPHFKPYLYSHISNQPVDFASTLIVHWVGEEVVKRWTAIAKYFEHVISARGSYLNKDIHDRLLFDDFEFSRSRTYFWAVDFLAELDLSISDNIMQFKLWVEWIDQLRSSFQSTEYGERTLKGINEVITDLTRVRDTFVSKRNEAIAIRDGLFNAGALHESIAATELGETVKLLTYVTIFYLPLSFSMSIWAINDQLFSLRALVAVAISVALSTYFFVFNLNSLVHLCKLGYNIVKDFLVDQMKDSGGNWSKRAADFKPFPPKQKSNKPSEWMLVVFVMYRLWTLPTRLYDKFKEHLLNQMAASQGKWAEYAENFDFKVSAPQVEPDASSTSSDSAQEMPSHPPKAEATTPSSLSRDSSRNPSKWMLLLFVLYRLRTMPTRSKADTKSKGEIDSEAATQPVAAQAD